MEIEDIVTYIECRSCWKDKLRSNLGVGQTRDGILIYCKAHREILLSVPQLFDEKDFKCECCECVKNYGDVLDEIKSEQKNFSNEFKNIVDALKNSFEVLDKFCSDFEKRLNTLENKET